jgi:copper chaperone CopZ
MAKDGVEVGLTPKPTPTGEDATAALTLEGMHCRSCALLIEETLVGEPGVHQATVDLDAGRAMVRFDPSTISVETLCAAVAGAGYRATPLAADDRVP